jgi:hypothetical protein
LALPGRGGLVDHDRDGDRSEEGGVSHVVTV